MRLAIYLKFTPEMRRSGEYVIDYENKARNFIRFHRRGDSEPLYDDSEEEGGTGPGPQPPEDKEKKRKQKQANAQNRDRHGKFKKGFKPGGQIERREFDTGHKLDKHGSSHDTKGQFPPGNKPWNKGKKSHRRK